MRYNKDSFDCSKSGFFDPKSTPQNQLIVNSLRATPTLTKSLIRVVSISTFTRQSWSQPTQTSHVDQQLRSILQPPAALN